MTNISSAISLPQQDANSLALSIGFGKATTAKLFTHLLTHKTATKHELTEITGLKRVSQAMRQCNQWALSKTPYRFKTARVKQNHWVWFIASTEEGEGAA